MRISSRIKEVKYNFIKFLKAPNDFKYRISNADKFKDILALVGLKLCIVIPLALLIYLLEKYEIIYIPDHFGEEMMQDKSFVEIVFLVAILAPFIEELIFRTFLVLRRFYPLLFFYSVNEDVWEKSIPCD